jgi:A118 family predicted phage portal protein
LHHIYEKIQTWSAWYSGDPDDLRLVYGGEARAAEYAPPSIRARGLKGILSRWFWGQGPQLNTRSSKLHIPLGGNIAAKSADLLFSDPPKFKLKDKATQDRMDELVDDGMHADLIEAAEICAGLGGVYLRVVWDKSIRKRPWITAVHADAAVPEWRWGQLTAVTFWRELERQGQTVFRHLERHEVGYVLHGLYQGTDERLGRKVPLTEHSDLAGIAEVIEEGDRVPTGIDMLTAVYVPNMRPNRVWRNVPAAASLGRADVSGSESQLDALDEVYTSWMRDIRLGKGRVFVPDIYLQSNGPGGGATFNAEREIYETLNMLPQADGTKQLTISQFEIRVAEHQATSTALMETIIQSSGYAQESFGLKGDGVATTATEITDRQRASFTTRDKKIMYWRPALKHIVNVLLLIDQQQFNSAITPAEPDLTFPDAVSEDPTTVATTLQLLETARAMSTKIKVERLHPEWDDAEVKEEVDRIQLEQGFGPGAPADPITVLGDMAGNNPPGAPGGDGGKPGDAPGGKGSTGTPPTHTAPGAPPAPGKAPVIPGSKTIGTPAPKAPARTGVN